MRLMLAAALFVAFCQQASGENRLIRTECNGGVCRKVTVGSGWEYEVVDRTNDIRRRHGLRPVKVTERAMKFARGWSGTQARQRRMYHSGAAGWSENVIWNYKSPKAMVDAWYASPGHRRNMLNPGHTEIGVGVVMSSNGPYGTQVFK